MKNEAIETVEYKGYTINIYSDDTGGSENDPRGWDNLGIMSCFHRRYDLGDKHNLSVEELKEIVNRKDVIALPLFLYDHSGISMSTGRNYPFNDRWDSGQVGYIYVDYEIIRKEYSVKHVSKQLREKVEKILEQEVKTYNQYLTGDIYGYVIVNDRGEDKDSCWGFFGQEGIKDAISECQNIIEYYIEQEKEQNAIDHAVEVGELVYA